jgi:hypothetical protein
MASVWQGVVAAVAAGALIATACDNSALSGAVTGSAGASAGPIPANPTNGGGADAGGASGNGGNAGGGTAGDAGKCPTEYDLPHYTGSTADLCDPGESMLCTCKGDKFDAEVPECTPDGTACIIAFNSCSDFIPVPGAECGWDAEPPACPALVEAVTAAIHAGATGPAPCTSDADCAPPCTSDADCAPVPGHYCNVRLANRMFCNNSFPVFRASDYCTDAGDASADSDLSADAGAD